MAVRAIDRVHRWRRLAQRASTRSRLTSSSWWSQFFRWTRSEVELEACRDCGLVRVRVVQSNRVAVIDRDEFYFIGLAWDYGREQAIDSCWYAAWPYS